MSVRLREVFSSIPTYRPGSSPEETGGAKAIKLSSNESPWGPPEQVVEAVRNAASTLNRYPDFYKEDLCKRLADTLGLDPGEVSVDNGSGTLLQDLVRIVCDAGDDVAFCSPTFAAYDIDVLLAGATPHHVPLDEDYRFDLEALASSIGPRTRMVIICNPNNPTGTFLATDEIRSFLQKIPQDILVVIDEAYRDFATVEDYGASLALLKDFDNVALLRTFSKALGLAGMRIGYCLSRPEVTDAINKTVAEFSVSTPAQAAGLAALEPEVHDILEARTQAIVEQREFLEKRLSDAGIAYIPSQSNFVMLPGPCMERFEALKQAGVIVRPFDDPKGVRITIGTAQDMELVAKGLAL